MSIASAVHELLEGSPSVLGLVSIVAAIATVVGTVISFLQWRQRRAGRERPQSGIDSPSSWTRPASLPANQIKIISPRSGHVEPSALIRVDAQAGHDEIVIAFMQSQGQIWKAAPCSAEVTSGTSICTDLRFGAPEEGGTWNLIAGLVSTETAQDIFAGKGRVADIREIDFKAISKPCRYFRTVDEG